MNRQPGVSRSVQWVGVIFAMTFPTLATWLYFVVLAGDAAIKPAYVTGKAIQFGFPILWLLGVEKANFAWSKPNRDGVRLGAAFGLLVALAALGLYYGFLRDGPLFSTAPRELNERLKALSMNTPIRFLMLGTFYSLVHSLLEEYYWRWFVFGRLRFCCRVKWAIVFSSLAFMSHHVLVVGEFLGGFGIAAVGFSLCVAVGGAAWAWMYQRYGSLYSPWISHMLVDAALMWIGYDLWRHVGR